MSKLMKIIMALAISVLLTVVSVITYNYCRNKAIHNTVLSGIKTSLVRYKNTGEGLDKNLADIIEPNTKIKIEGDYCDRLTLIVKPEFNSLTCKDKCKLMDCARNILIVNMVYADYLKEDIYDEKQSNALRDKITIFFSCGDGSYKLEKDKIETPKGKIIYMPKFY